MLALNNIDTQYKMGFGNFLASFGRGYAIISAIFATLFSAILLVLGVWLIFFSPKDDTKDEKKQNPVTGGLFMIFIGVMILIVSWAWVYLSQRSRLAAQYEGIVGGINIAQRLL